MCDVEKFLFECKCLVPFVVFMYIKYDRLLKNHICNKFGIKVVKNAVGTFTEFKVAYIEQPVERTEVFD